MTIVKNKLRVGNFTNSQIHRLTGLGKREMTDEELAERPKKGVGSAVKFIEDPNSFDQTGLSYIEEKNMERRYNLSLNKDVYTQTTQWGHFCERWVHEKNYLGYGYVSTGSVTVVHPTITFWAGSPDNENPIDKIIGDVKALERKEFYRMAEAIEAGTVEAFKEYDPQKYWQLVGNAIIFGYDKIQPVLFMPFESELDEMADFAHSLEGEDLWKNKFIYDAVSEGRKESLNYLQDGGYYNNLITNIYDIPQQDKDFLTARVILAGTKLNPFYVPKTK